MPVHALTAAPSDRARPARAGRDPFAPGHLGELTQLLPSEMADAALAETGTAGKRLREVPSRVVVYLLLAACLFPDVGYTGVWRKLVAGLRPGVSAAPSASALSQARHRIGPAPLRWLFGLLCGPDGATPSRTGVWWKGLLVTAIDGTTLTVPDAERVRARYTKQAGNHGGTGYPQLRVMALVACGTRALVDAVFGPTTTGETNYVPGLLGSLRAGMIVLADRNFDAKDVLTGIARAEADFLVRAKTIRRLPVMQRHRDGSFTSKVDGLTVRVVDAEVTITTPARTEHGSYRLLTTLLDPDRYPADQLVRLYHERWEVETTYLELKSSMLGGRVLRARTAAGIDQEVHALLVTYQLLRSAISDATLASGLDPDRASFTVAFQTARDQLVLAENVIAGTEIDLIGTIGRQVLTAPLPKRRLRVSPRIVKRAISKYQARGPIIDRTSYQARLDIRILTGEPP